MDQKKRFAHIFIILVLTALLALVAYIFQPFLLDIILAGVLASFFYPVYKFTLKYVRYPHLAALLVTILIVVIILGPLGYFIGLLINKTLETYNNFLPYIANGNIAENLSLGNFANAKIAWLQSIDLSKYLADIFGYLRDVAIVSSTYVVKETTSVVTSFFMIMLTIFFLLVDGKKFMRKVMNLTPLPNRYDVLLFNTFREVSFSSVISTILVAIVQGTIGGIAFAIIGLPGLFFGVLMAGFSILPIFGTFLVWGPALAVLALQGRFGDALIILIFGLIISTIDNVLRSYLLKGKTKVHELILFFSIVGAIPVFGFLGIFVGPLLISLLFTVIKIYELEFAEDLEVTK